MAKIRYYFANYKRSPRLFNQWDIIAFFFIIAVIVLLSWGATEMASPYHVGQSLPITLAPEHLIAYSARTVLRMAIAMCFSLLFTFTVGTWAAKSQRAARIIIPLIDILQAVPVLSFLSITIVGFIALFPGSLLGPECASIFAIFTAQAWNMTLGFYQTLRTVPADLKEAAEMFHLSAWQRFWRVEVPFSMSSLLWNMMISMSASWFFVVASEAISVSNQQIRLPGIGSYISLAIQQADLHAVAYAIGAMFIIILIYDQLLFRPLIKWSEKFKFDEDPSEKPTDSWFLSVLGRTHLLKLGGHIFMGFADRLVDSPRFKPKSNTFTKEKSLLTCQILNWLWYAVLILIFTSALIVLTHFITNNISFNEIIEVLFLGFATLTRVIILIIISSLIWIPIGVKLARNARLASKIQPIIQFAASFPANLLFPIVVMLIVHYHLNANIWVSPLMILGSQWYILFNVIAGAMVLPKEMYHVADNLGVKGWQWWKRLALPGIFPYYITGAMTAAGGAWNASIVAEWVSWGDTHIKATGLGAYIAEYTQMGDFPRIALGTTMMCLFVLLFNRILWQPLFRLAETKYST